MTLEKKQIRADCLGIVCYGLRINVSISMTYQNRLRTVKQPKLICLNHMT